MRRTVRGAIRGTMRGRSSKLPHREPRSAGFTVQGVKKSPGKISRRFELPMPASSSRDCELVARSKRGWITGLSGDSSWSAGRGAIEVVGAHAGSVRGGTLHVAGTQADSGAFALPRGLDGFCAADLSLPAIWTSSAWWFLGRRGHERMLRSRFRGHGTWTDPSHFCERSVRRTEPPRELAAALARATAEATLPPP